MKTSYMIPAVTPDSRTVWKQIDGIEVWDYVRDILTDDRLDLIKRVYMLAAAIRHEQDDRKVVAE